VDPVRNHRSSPAAVPTDFGSTRRLGIVFPVVHTSYDYDEEIF
jgi:hypothetical protein